MASISVWTIQKMNMIDNSDIMSNKSCREVSVSLVIPHLGQNLRPLCLINKQNKHNTLLFRKAITVHTLHSSFLSLQNKHKLFKVQYVSITSIWLGRLPACKCSRRGAKQHKWCLSRLSHNVQIYHMYLDKSKVSSIMAVMSLCDSHSSHPLMVPINYSRFSLIRIEIRCLLVSTMRDENPFSDSFSLLCDTENSSRVLHFH